MTSFGRATLTAFCLLWFSPANAGAIASTASCVQHNAQSLLEQARAELKLDGSWFPGLEARFLPLAHAGRDLQWMATAWDSPPGGVLFVLNCAGNVIAAKRIGAVRSLGAGPGFQIGETAEVVYVSGYGTGVVETSVGLYHFDGTKVELLWKHEATGVVSMPSFGMDYTEEFHWRMTPDGTRIHVTGRRRVGEVKDPDHGWPPHTEHALPNQSYCWNPSKKRYLRCR